MASIVIAVLLGFAVVVGLPAALAWYPIRKHAPKQTLPVIVVAANLWAIWLLVFGAIGPSVDGNSLLVRSNRCRLGDVAIYERDPTMPTASSTMALVRWQQRDGYPEQATLATLAQLKGVGWSGDYVYGEVTAPGSESRRFLRAGPHWHQQMWAGSLNELRVEGASVPELREFRSAYQLCSKENATRKAALATAVPVLVVGALAIAILRIRRTAAD